jgi:antitoxin FitA
LKSRHRIRDAFAHAVYCTRALQTTLKGAARAPPSNLYERIRALVEPLGGIDLELPPREPTRDPPTFD